MTLNDNFPSPESCAWSSALYRRIVPTLYRLRPWIPRCLTVGISAQPDGTALNATRWAARSPIVIRAWLMRPKSECTVWLCRRFTDERLGQSGENALTDKEAPALNNRAKNSHSLRVILRRLNNCDARSTSNNWYWSHLNTKKSNKIEHKAWRRRPMVLAAKKKDSCGWPKRERSVWRCPHDFYLGILGKLSARDWSIRC